MGKMLRVVGWRLHNLVKYTAALAVKSKIVATQVLRIGFANPILRKFSHFHFPIFHNAGFANPAKKIVVRRLKACLEPTKISLTIYHNQINHFINSLISLPTIQ